MREIEQAREALDRAEKSLERYRWIILNPDRASMALRIAIVKTGRTAEIADIVVQEIDHARKQS